MSEERINKIIEKLKDFSYQPKPARRTYIPKKNGKLRPLGIPSIDDKLVQEVVRMLLIASMKAHSTTGLMVSDLKEVVTLPYIRQERLLQLLDGSWRVT